MVWKILVLAFLAASECSAAVTKNFSKLQGLEDKASHSEAIANQFLELSNKENCEKNGGPDAYINAQNAMSNFADSIMRLMDPEGVVKEIQEAKSKGALHEVIKKYCDQAPELKNSIHTLSSQVSQCFEPSLREQLPATNNATDRLIDYLCYKDGEGIVLFIADDGPECFDERGKGISDCALNMVASLSNAEQVKFLTYPEQCAKFDQLSTCILDEFKKCSSSTPAKTMESLFKFIRKGAPCGQ